MTGIQKKQRLLTMIFGAFAIFFTGYPHVWSIYQPYVMEQAGWSQGQASMCFYLALSTFVFGNIVGGRMQNRFKEKTIVWIGAGSCGRNPGIRISDRSHTASYVSVLWRDAGIWTGNDLHGDSGNRAEMVPGPYRICFRRCGNCQRTLRIFPGAAESKAAGGRGAGRNLSDHWGSHRSFLDSVRSSFFRHPIRVW